MSNFSGLVTVDGLTVFYPISRRQIYRWIDHGCPSRLVGRKRLFKLGAVEFWLTRYNSGDWRVWHLPHEDQIEPMVRLPNLIKIFPVSRRQVYRWMKLGCPSRRIGHTRMFCPGAVEVWLAQFNQGDWAKEPQGRASGGT